MDEKRAHTRQLMREDAVLADATGAARYPVVILDISRVGVSFASPAQLEAGSRHILNFRLPGNAQVQETVLQVVHSTSAGVPAGFRIGARFVHIASDTTDIIASFVTSMAPA
jgi:hypothetical protein